MEIEIKAPYLLNGKQATKFVISPIGFMHFTRLTVEASDESTDENPTRVLLRSKLVRARTRVMTDDGNQHELSALDLMAMPLPVAKPLVSRVDGDTDGDSKTEILESGDGLTAPILVKLAHPVSTSGDKEIAELEFMAKTYGDIEHVLAQSSDIEKAAELIKKVAKPAGMLALPDWAAEAISVQDGVNIMLKVLPRFLE